MDQFCTVGNKYLKQNPKRRAENASDLAVDALSEAFPCKK
ncbi:Rap1a/Tai family immunity protein [Escherichia coli]